VVASVCASTRVSVDVPVASSGEKDAINVARACCMSKGFSRKAAAPNRNAVAA
jgi:hypothetical protein